MNNKEKIQNNPCTKHVSINLRYKFIDVTSMPLKKINSILCKKENKEVLKHCI